MFSPCVRGIESWLASSISPASAARFELLDPLDQSALAHEPAAAQPEIGDAWKADNSAVQQVAKLSLAASEHLRSFFRRQYLW